MNDGIATLIAFALILLLVLVLVVPKPRHRAPAEMSDQYELHQTAMRLDDVDRRLNALDLRVSAIEERPWGSQ